MDACALVGALFVLFVTIVTLAATAKPRREIAPEATVRCSTCGAITTRMQLAGNTPVMLVCNACCTRIPAS